MIYSHHKKGFSFYFLLLNYGLENFMLLTLLPAGKLHRRHTLVPGRAFIYCVALIYSSGLRGAAGSLPVSHHQSLSLS